MTTDTLLIVIAFGAIGMALRYRIMKWLIQGDCAHRRVTMPIRGRDGKYWSSCLDCGKDLDYRVLTRAEWLN